MKQNLKVILLVFACFFITAGSAFANNITIYDNRSGTYYGSSGDGWWTSTDENQEVEPGMINNQNWDLEAFLLDDFTLSIVGGFDFVNGYQYSGTTYTAGDIFLDITGDAWYGTDGTYPLNYGYEYVIDVDWANYSYIVYALDDTSQLSDVFEPYNQIESNPFTLNYTDEAVVDAGGTFSYSSYTDEEGTHYTVTGFDLSFLGCDQDFISHFTISCGNDNLMGSGTTPVPEPATMLLLGSGLMGLFGLGRKRLGIK